MSADMYFKNMPLSFEQINERIAYDPLTGSFTWKVAPCRRMKAGDECGTVKSPRIDPVTGKKMGYKYIRVLHNETPAARVAWLLTYGKWPDGPVSFKDGDSENLRIDNLNIAEVAFPTVKEIKGDRKSYKLSHAAQRHYGLKRYYGITLETYNVMLAGQNGVCAMCGGVESYVPKGHGTPKPLSVDHNHATGQIRGLLCSHCNYVIGFCKEDREILLQAIAYLDKHAGTAKPAPVLELFVNEAAKESSDV
jgi:hypothetical protein